MSTGEQESDAVISIRGVTKRFGSHTVLSDVSFDVPRGKTSAVLGPSGTGKSVLLKIVIGLLRPEAGQVYVDGEPIVGVPERDVMRIRRKFGVLFQDGALFGSMNLFDNIAFPLVEHTKMTQPAIRDVVLAKSELVGLGAHLHKLPGEVSGGMRKRAGLARALVLEPEILFFDEPDSGLDPVRVAYLDQLITRVQRETGTTFFIISHNIESVKRTSHYLGLLFQSRLVAFGPKEAMTASTVPVIQQFLAGRPEGPISMDEMADADAPAGGVGVAAPAGGGGGGGPAAEAWPAVAEAWPAVAPAVAPAAAAAPGTTVAEGWPAVAPAPAAAPGATPAEAPAAVARPVGPFAASASVAPPEPELEDIGSFWIRAAKGR